MSNRGCGALLGCVPLAHRVGGNARNLQVYANNPREPGVYTWFHADLEPQQSCEW